MEISSSIVGGAIAQPLDQERQVRVLKKALEAEAATALALIDAVPKPQPVAASNPPHLGQNIDTRA
ncbi:putative motility protein [Thiobacter aerophilum]|uniref:Motility protein n=1 Tax=Thiobacter aerophilum TaxID=3121275 RepID=A0ABV0EEY0_9BURK